MGKGSDVIDNMKKVLFLQPSITAIELYGLNEQPLLKPTFKFAGLYGESRIGCLQLIFAPPAGDDEPPVQPLATGARYSLCLRLTDRDQAYRPNILLRTYRAGRRIHSPQVTGMKKDPFQWGSFG